MKSDTKARFVSNRNSPSTSGDSYISHAYAYERSQSAAEGLISQPFRVNTSIYSPINPASNGPSSAPSTFWWDSPGPQDLGKPASPKVMTHNGVYGSMQPKASSTPIQNSIVRTTQNSPSIYLI